MVMTAATVGRCWRDADDPVAGWVPVAGRSRVAGRLSPRWGGVGASGALWPCHAGSRGRGRLQRPLPPPPARRGVMSMGRPLPLPCGWLLFFLPAVVWCGRPPLCGRATRRSLTPVRRWDTGGLPLVWWLLSRRSSSPTASRRQDDVRGGGGWAATATATMWPRGGGVVAGDGGATGWLLGGPGWLPGWLVRVVHGAAAGPTPPSRAPDLWGRRGGAWAGPTARVMCWPPAVGQWGGRGGHVAGAARPLCLSGRRVLAPTRWAVSTGHRRHAARQRRPRRGARGGDTVLAG